MAMYICINYDCRLVQRSDKLLLSLDILLEFREFFKKGQPIGNIISAKLLTLKAKCKEVCIIIVYYSYTV